MKNKRKKASTRHLHVHETSVSSSYSIHSNAYLISNLTIRHKQNAFKTQNVQQIVNKIVLKINILVQAESKK